MRDYIIVTKKKLQLLLICAGVMMTGLQCQQMNDVLKSRNARQTYVKGLQESPLAQKPLVQQWQEAGDSTLHQPVPIDFPFQTKMIYFRDEARAWAWQFSLDEGRTIRVHLAQADTTQRVFMDLFSKENGDLKLKKMTEDSLIFFTPDQNQTLVLRIQPELLVDGSITLQLTDHPSMGFPVQGGSHADIGGRFGDPRAGGARKHKGIDIFADRGTPVLAVEDGRVSRTGNHGLGGKQVWLRVNGRSLYYAHLDSIIGHSGNHVQTGDTLGLVGNTGNARNSPTHLHFGIYEHGAVDPLPFVDVAHTNFKPVAADLADVPQWDRISASKANVRPLPSTQKPPLTSLSSNNPIKITGGTGDWYQVVLPDESTGFIYRTLVEPAAQQLEAKTMDSSDRLFARFTSRRAAFHPDSSQQVGVYGTYQRRELIKYHGHWGWLRN